MWKETSAESMHRWRRGLLVVAGICAILALLFPPLGALGAIIGLWAELYFGKRERKLHQDERDTLTKRVAAAEVAAAPRTLSPEQKQKLVSKLSVHSGQRVVVFCNQGDAEAFNFAREFHDVFRKAGWNLGDIQQLFVTTTPEFGVVVAVRDGKNPPRCAQILLSALNEIGVENVGSKQKPDHEEGSIFFLIGHKQHSKGNVPEKRA